MQAALAIPVLKVLNDIAKSKLLGKKNKNKIGKGNLLRGAGKETLEELATLTEVTTKRDPPGSKFSLQNALERIQRNIGGQQLPIARITGSPQSVMSASGGTTSMVVVKTEAFYAVPGSVNFSVAGSDFYPQAVALPWLSGISKSFVEYKVLDLEFTYVPYVPTTTAGSVAVAWTGDYTDTDPTDMLQMLSSEQAIIAPVYAGSEGGQALQFFGIPKGNVVGFKVPRYTYTTGNIPKTYRNLGSTKFGAATTEMRNQYSPGRLLIATSGMASTATVGYVFVRYKIQLLGSVNSTLNT